MDGILRNDWTEWFGISGRNESEWVDDLIRNQWTECVGIRKYLCRACGAVFCERKSTVFYDIRSDEGKVILALKLILQGMSLRAVSNVLDVKLDTVRFWLTRSATHAEQVNEALIKEIKVNKVELDELWSFVRKKNFRDWQKARKKTMAPAGSGSPWHRNTD